MAIEKAMEGVTGPSPRENDYQRAQFAQRESAALVSAINEIDLTPEQKARLPDLFAKHWARLGSLTP